MRHLLIVGRPGAGKTALLARLAHDLRGGPVDGFVTEELRESGERLGYWLSSLDGRQLLIAHRRLDSAHRVGPYKVNVDVINDVAVGILRRAMSKAHLVVVDEISRLLLCSQAFEDALGDALTHGPRIIATASSQPQPFVDQLKRRTDVELVPLTSATWQSVYEELTTRLHALCEADERVAGLQRQADHICEMIVSVDVPEIDIEIQQAQLRDAVARLFPEKQSLYQLLYEGRFRRLWLQFRQV